MPLTSLVQAHIDRLRAFLADPDGVVLELRAAAEQQALVVKLMVGLSEEGDDLWAAVDAADVEPDAFALAIAAAVEAALADAAKELAAAQVELRMPAPLEHDDTRPRRAVEHRVIEYCERAALAMVPFLRGLVVAIRVDAPRALALAQTIGRLVEACEGGRVRFVVLTTPEAPLVREVAVLRPRTTVWADGDACDLRDLRRVGIEPLPRLLAYDAPRRGQTWMPPALVEAGLANGNCIVRVDAVRFWRPIHFYARAAELVVEACAAVLEPTKLARRIAPFREEVAAPRGREDAEIPFADLLDRLQREALPPDWGLVVVLAPDCGDDVPPAEFAAFAASLRELARALVSPRVKVFAVAPGLGTLARPRERSALRVQQLRIDATVIEAGLTNKLAEPELSPAIRLRCLAALASLRMGQGDPEAAIDLNVQTLELAQTTEHPIEIAAAWYGLGSSLYRCGALDKASDAYARCTDLAVTHDHPALAAHGITGMAHCELVIGHCDRAIEYYTIAAKYWRNLANPMAEAYVLVWMAEAHAKADRKPLAVATFDEALARCDTAHEAMKDAADSMRADILQRKARVYGSVGLTAEKRKHTDLARTLGATAPPSIEP